MIIIDKEYKFDSSFNQTHKLIPFSLDEDYKALEIEFSYGPKLCEGPLTDLAKKEGFEKLKAENLEISDSLMDSNILNLISLSVRKDGRFLGNYHNHKSEQEILISKDKSSFGFNRTDISRGDYEIILSFHNILTDVTLKLKVGLK